MSRVILGILLLVLVVIVVAPVRERVRPHLQPALDPLYEWNARNRVKEIRNLVKRADATGRQVPAPGDFPRFVESEDMKANASIDPWGRPYYLLTSRRGFRVGSAGKDGQAGTADDILTDEEPLANPPQGRRR